MSVERTTLYGTSNIGVFVLATDKYALLPEDAPPKFIELINEILRPEAVLCCNINNSRIVGVLAAGNSKGILLSPTISPDEYKEIHKVLKDLVVIDILPSKFTAVGNLILANDKAALAYRKFEKETLRVIEDVLDVEVMRGTIAEIEVVGSAAVVTNVGLMAHPDTSPEELRKLSKFFKVEMADVGTINRGKPFIRVGLIVNTKGALAGSETTGPELVHIEQIFGLTGV